MNYHLILGEMEYVLLMKIGIIGYGHVGMAMHKLFADAIIYDKFKNINSIDDINSCDVAFVCVPTPSNTDESCDTSIVESVIMECEASLIIIRSTVTVGFTTEMVKKYNKRIVFQPEYYGETVAHPFADLANQNWLCFGGEEESVNMAIDVYKTVVNSSVYIYQGTSEEMELAKYLENSFLATKVIFFNEFHELCNKMNINFNKVREFVTADPRIGRSHTFVYKDNPGFGGSCLPKGTNAITKQANDLGVSMDVLKAVISKNKKIRNDS